MRIGHGFDVHAFGPGDRVILGGVTIPFSQGLVAHSDGDVVIHALCDALLGAAGMGDIGRHFPDHDPAWRDADSRLLLHQVRAWLSEQNWRIGNVDMTVVAQAPRLASYIPVMRERLAEDLQCPLDAVNIKATTTEKLGYIGRSEGIACHAVALIERPRATERD